MPLYVIFLVFSSQCFAEGGEAPDLASRYSHYYVNIYVNDDSSLVETYDWAKKILQERAVAGAKQASVTYSTSIQKAEVLEAYTLKADGRRIDAPKSNYQLEINKGKDKESPVFSDLTTLTVVFPDVAVGDTVALSYNVTESEPMFPGKFSTNGVFSKVYAYDDVKIKLDYPSSLPVQYEGRKMAEKASEKDGRKVIEWTYQNSQPIKNKREDFSVFDIEKEPGYAFSTFKSYEDIAESYGVRARPKAVVTEQIQKLADEVAKDKKIPKEQASALYEWVATNISYAGNCIGVGAVVPHDTKFILDNRIGDCKDHATLLQALLAAKGIKSTQALVNSGSAYKLPKIPVISMVNHVITYIPSLDLFLDSTSDSTPFGMLPFSSADKPALLVDGYKAGVRTPTIPVGANQQYMKSVIKINPDGSITGDIAVDLKGQFAVTARSQLRQMPKDREDDLVKNVFKGMGHIGSGKIDKEDPKALLDTYKYKVKFDMKEFIQLPGTGAFVIGPLFFSEAPIFGFLGSAVAQEETVDTTCGSGTSVEEYSYQFPKGMKILAVPDDMTVTDNLVTYRATYIQKGSTLTVKRTLEDKTHGNVCGPEIATIYKRFATKVLQNVKSQVVYK